ncbi:MAG TPA: rhodanese-like domain-containing protein [Mucilaginibacter sp.]|jgi:rhodanese-related sulfurtransferase|nr:rhodanese-like domain-containing protein [Mucilaginibacter sp.]
MTDINASEMAGRLKLPDPAKILDVREPIEFHTWNIGGINVPLGALEQDLDRLGWNKNDEIIVVCRAGIRSATAKSILELNGFKNIRNLTGGLLALQRIRS